jgi:micrococcal nuclease
MVRSRAVVVATLAAASVLGASVLGWWLGGVARTAEPHVRVIEVVDGDTIIVAFANGATDTVRLLGVDTPETKHPTKGVECFGPEAAAFTTRRLLGRVVRLESDVERRDVYGRRLAYVRLDGERFNDVLLRRGYARFLVIPPNDAHGRDLLAAELDARRHRRGLWAECET